MVARRLDPVLVGNREWRAQWLASGAFQLVDFIAVVRLSVVHATIVRKVRRCWREGSIQVARGRHGANQRRCGNGRSVEFLAGLFLSMSPEHEVERRFAVLRGRHWSVWRGQLRVRSRRRGLGDEAPWLADHWRVAC